MCLAPITLSTKSGHVQACRLVHGLYMANLTKCFDMSLYLHKKKCLNGRAEGKLQSKQLGYYNLILSQISEVELPLW